MTNNELINVSVDKTELTMLIEAIDEYEEIHYKTENNKWQKAINNLILKLNQIKENNL